MGRKMQAICRRVPAVRGPSMQQIVAKDHPAPSRERDNLACGLYETTTPPRRDRAWPNDQPARMQCNQNAVPLMGNAATSIIWAGIGVATLLCQLH